MSIATTLLTAEEFARLPDNGRPTELVRGQVVTMNVPSPRHGQVCVKVVRILGDFVEEHDLGHVVSNDAGVITGRDPDTVRGADVAFYSYAKVPKGPLPKEYLPVPPEVVFEIRSPTDRRSQVLAKVAEYLEVGVSAVCVLDPESNSAQVFYQDQPLAVLSADDDLTFPELLGEFRVPVGRFFE